MAESEAGADRGARVLAGRAAGSVALVARAAPGMLALRGASTVLDGAWPVATAWLASLLIDRLATGHGPDPVLLAALAAALGAATAVARYLGQYAGQEIGRRVTERTRSELFAAVVRDPGIARLEDPGYHDRLQLAQQASQLGPAQLVDALLAVLGGAVTAVGFVSALAARYPLVAALVLISTLPALYGQIGLGRLRVRTLEAASPRQRRQVFYAMLLLDLRAAKEIRLFGLGEFFRTRMIGELRATQEAQRTADRAAVRLDGGLALLSAAVSGLALILAVRRLEHGQGTVGDLAVLTAAIASVQGALAGILAQVALAGQSLTMFGHYQALTRDPAVPAGPAALAAPAPAPSAPPLRTGIRFDDVWFRYQQDQPWVLRGLDLGIPHGACVALVGLNGAGKSTLVKLLCRLYEPTKGSIGWDGTDLARFDPASLRSRIGAVFQDHMAFDLTAAENIAVGDLSALVDPPRLRAAARRAGIDDKLAALPEGYATMLSRMYGTSEERRSAGVAGRGDAVLRSPGGVVLSGGQWQRVAIARAMLREEADLLILDEPSSGLDPRAEHEIHRMLGRLRRGRTSLLISHRLNAVREADLIVVLEDGRIVERGTHEQLTSDGGRYAELVRLQAAGYRPVEPVPSRGKA
ncbi:ABC transporter ATP-binding protein [Actinospica robiniae]|uniref:ABC transporter ATP-binding protein n=1 Tax=Actinospica robiniae TaxID=304901 RepID=UPI0004093EA0|nr:ABC transporter ATP-binding protein [Actinospica robiniae]